MSVGQSEFQTLDTRMVKPQKSAYVGVEWCECGLSGCARKLLLNIRAARF